MICPRYPACGGKAEIISDRYHYTESGLDNVWLENCKVYVCSQCGSRSPMLPDADSSTRVIAVELILRDGPMTGDEIVFLRKAMGLRVEKLAAILRVEPRRLSLWENDRRLIDAIYDLRLRITVVNSFFLSNSDFKDKITFDCNFWNIADRAKPITLDVLSL